MAQEHTQPAGAAQDRPALEQWIIARQGVLAVGLFVAAALFAALAIYHLVLQVRSGAANVPILVWAVVLAAVCLFSGLYLHFQKQSGNPPQRGAFLILVLAAGGAAGLFTFLFLGLWLPLKPWYGSIIPATDTADTRPILQLWKENWWRIGVVGLALVGGLALMFLSLLPARGVERASAGMRRLLYGYNAALTGLLLLAILGLVNVMAYFPMWPFTAFDRLIDWTPSQLYTLSERSVNILQNLDGPVEVLALMPFNDGFGVRKEVDRLIDNCQRYRDDITLTHLSPDRNPREFVKALEQYGSHFGELSLLSDPYFRTQRIGLVVLYRKGGKEDVQFVPFRDLFERPPRRPNEPDTDRIIFKGENALMRSLQALSQKEPTKVYFTKGHGELEFNPPPGLLGGQSLGLLRQRLEAKGNFEIKEIDLSTGSAKGLEEADVVVVARPTMGFRPEAVKALRNYLKPTGTSKKGTLVVLLDSRSQGGKMLQTGLEDLLGEYNVKVGDTRLLSMSNEPASVFVTISGENRTALAQSFAAAFSVQALPMSEPRRVEPAGNAAAGLSVEPLLVSIPRMPVFEAENLTASARDIVAEYRKPDFPANKRPELLVRVPTAVTVAESKPRPGLPARHVPIDKEPPRMIVFGGASWITDDVVSGAHGNSCVNLFASGVAWLHGRTDLGPDVAPVKDRPLFTLAGKVEGGVSRLIWLPLALTLLGIVGLGGGIWVARRR